MIDRTVEEVHSIYSDKAEVKTEWLSEPNEEGWWWFKNEYHFYPCAIADGIIQDFIHPTTFSLSKYLSSYKGKWCKAQIPESED